MAKCNNFVCVCGGGGGGVCVCVGGGGGSYFIDVRNMHDCYMKFDYVRVSLTREKYWYEIRDVLVLILQALWGIGTNSSRHEIYEVWNLRFNKALLIDNFLL